MGTVGELMLRKDVNPVVRLALGKALVTPALTFDNSIFERLPDTAGRQLEAVQTTTLRRATNNFRHGEVVGSIIKDEGLRRQCHAPSVSSTMRANRLKHFGRTHARGPTIIRSLLSSRTSS